MRMLHLHSVKNMKLILTLQNLFIADNIINRSYWKLITLYVNGERLISELESSESSPVALGPTKLMTVYFEVTSLRPTKWSGCKCLYYK